MSCSRVTAEVFGPLLFSFCYYGNTNLLKRANSYEVFDLQLLTNQNWEFGIAPV